MGWLGWLASAMRDANETELWLHDQVGPPAFLRKVRLAYGLLVGLLVGSLSELVFGLGSGLVVGLGVGLVVPEPAYRIPFDLHEVPRRLTSGLLIGLLGALVVGLLGALVFGLVVGLVYALAFGLVNRGPDRTRIAVHLPTQVIGDSARLGLVSGLLVALILGLLVGLGRANPRAERRAERRAGGRIGRRADPRAGRLRRPPCVSTPAMAQGLGSAWMAAIS